MPVTLTITWKGVLLSVLGIAGIILLVYLILLIRKLIETLRQVDEIMADAKVVSGVAADKAQKVDGIIEGAADTVGTVVNAIKGNQNMVNAATNFVNATSSLAGMMKKSGNKPNSKKSKQKG
ncbi:MAG: hypothetical protein IJB73_01970 [Firmicutes bacterium]|nr:hypothetical protein [Bacillota bacterium]